MLVHPSAIDLSSSALRFLARQLAVHRQRIGSRWRRLTPGRQALLALAPLRCGDTYTRLAAGFGIGLATVCRYVHETVDVLAALAESLPAAKRLAYAVGLVELAEERTRRGGHERRYRTVHGSPLSDQHDGAPLLAATLAHTLQERAARRDQDSRGVMVDAELWVEPEVWEEVRRRLADIGAELHDAAHTPRSPGTVPVGISLMAFRMQAPPPADG